MEYSFHNLVDLKKIQQLLEIFTNLAGVSVALIEPDVTFMPEKGWQKICSQFHQKHSVSAEQCRYSNEMLKNYEGEEKYNIATCPNGLIHAAAPVVIQGETVATVIASQFLIAPPDM
ncbi:MAG: PocR ligand-binding domain-containing protein, partial [Syntrophomonadaceae bacterium]|nr:PocR ligand-binding domain-containing protein [Syntrophomonadaceae bacterium]